MPKVFLHARVTQFALTIIVVAVVRIQQPEASAAPNWKLAIHSYFSTPLSRGRENKLLLRARAPGGDLWAELDTGAPITCADKTKPELFHFRPIAPPVRVILNGTPHQLALIPWLDFNQSHVEDVPAVLVDFRGMNAFQTRNLDRADDAIIGLDALRALHAVIDCGSRRLLVRAVHDSGNGLGAGLVADGWREIPMRLADGHLMVSATMNGSPARCLIDTGSPFSVLDRKYCTEHRIPMEGRTFAMQAIHFSSNSAQVGEVEDFRISGVSFGRTRVAVFNLSALLQKPEETISGLVSSGTLEHLHAFIDCDRMKLYVRPEGGAGGLRF